MSEHGLHRPIGEAGGLRVSVGVWPNYAIAKESPRGVVVEFRTFGVAGGMKPSEARGLAALLIAAADEHERSHQVTH